MKPFNYAMAVRPTKEEKNARDAQLAGEARITEEARILKEEERIFKETEKKNILHKLPRGMPFLGLLWLHNLCRYLSELICYLPYPIHDCSKIYLQ